MIRAIWCSLIEGGGSWVYFWEFGTAQMKVEFWDFDGMDGVHYAVEASLIFTWTWALKNYNTIAIKAPPFF